MDQQLNATAQQLVLAVNALTQAIKAVLPYVQSTATTATAGGGAAVPATVLGFANATLPDGTAVKYAYFKP